ncbi:MAG: M3 family metallopeptidase [Mariprofundus sp.]|nr:M3 family metallopeptidase [Mariprofundus sp.]
MNSNQASNPLIQSIDSELPLFSQIKPEHVLPALDYVLSQAHQVVDQLTTIEQPSWQSLMLPLEGVDEMLGRVWGPVTHLNAVCDSDELRPIYQQGMAEMAAWHTELAQNEKLYAAIGQVRQHPDFDQLSHQRQQVIEHALRDFRLSGAELEGDDRARFKTIMMRLSELSNAFSQHVLDATQAFELHLSNEEDIAGLPASIVEAAAQRAQQAGKSGYLITLDAPSYIPFMQHAQSSALREQLYRAFVTRASSGALDNGPLIIETLSLKQEAATLLGFNNCAAYSLATKMADNTHEVSDFLRELAAKSKPSAQLEVDMLKQFANQTLGLSTLNAWDIPFIAEKLRLQTFDISQEELKPYFPEKSVLNGMFGLVEKLFNITIRANEEAPRWHESVRYYELFDASNQKIAAFYLDPYARAHKRGGAWMDECITRWQRPDGALQLPVAYLVCNFDAPIGDKPALWTHDEVTTLFHEFGHGLNHMLTTMSELGISGIRGVPWDAVELPSQFMENFCWEKEVVDLFARHYQSGETMPEPLFQRMLSAKNFQSGMQMLRQVEFSLFDILLHSEFDTKGNLSVHQLLEQVRDEISVLKPAEFNRFENSFSHIFAGGYAAGYYSYKWAEVLSADAFAAFEEEGILNSDTAARFREHILAIGGSQDIMQQFTAFRGRKPTVAALLRHSGLA